MMADFILIVTKRLNNEELKKLTDIHGIEHLQNAINQTGNISNYRAFVQELIPNIIDNQ